MRVALVHDYLTQYGGAERVLEALHERYPDAPVFTSLYNPESFPASWRSWDIRTSPISKVPGATRTHRLWTPLYPAIFGQIGYFSIRDFDVVIADSSAFSHHARPRQSVPMICYCHSPARFLYRDSNYLDATSLPAVVEPLVNGMFGLMRRLDRRAGQHITHTISNSKAVRERIARAWGVQSEVIHPPVNIDRFRPDASVEPEDWFLVVSRLVPHKWIDRAVRACTTANLPLKVIGGGRSTASLRRIAGPSVEFLGECTDVEVADHMQRCRAFILPGVEDFGMTAVEAQAAGRPVIAAKGGGALESVIHDVTGLHVEPADDEGWITALLEARKRSWDSAMIQCHASHFSTSIFLEKMNAAVERVVASRSLEAVTRGAQGVSETETSRPSLPPQAQPGGRALTRLQPGRGK